MNDDRELLTALRDSLADATLSTSLEATVRRGRRLRARRRMAGVGAAAAVIAALITLTATGPGTASGPQDRLAAWTVTDLPHGLVVVRISQLRDPAGLQRTLRAHGVPAAVAFQAGVLSLDPPLPRACRDTGLSPVAETHLSGEILGPNLHLFVNGRPTVALTIRPAAIPHGIGLNLTVQWASNSWGWSFGLVRATPQCTGS